MNQPYDPNQQWGQPGQQPQTGSQQSWGQQPQTGSQQAWGEQPPAGQQYGQTGYDQSQQYGQPQQYGQTGYEQQGHAQQHGQPYGAPAGAQPWGSAPQKSGNGKLWAIIGGAVALLAAVGVTLWLVLSGGGRSVEATIDGFFDAAKANDKTAAKEYLCDKLDKQIDDSSGDSGLNPFNVDYKVGNVKEDGDTATADVTVTLDGKSSTGTVTLTKNDDGDWEICEFN